MANLKKILLFFLLLLPGAAALAGWTKLRSYGTEDDYNRRTQYADFDSRERHGDKIRIRDLSDYDAMQHSMPFGGYPYVSVVRVYELDCKEKSYRILNSKWFDSNMGTGNLIYSYDVPSGRTALSDAEYIYEETLWNAACKNDTYSPPAAGGDLR